MCLRWPKAGGVKGPEHHREGVELCKDLVLELAALLLGKVRHHREGGAYDPLSSVRRVLPKRNEGGGGGGGCSAS